MNITRAFSFFVFCLSCFCNSTWAQEPKVFINKPAVVLGTNVLQKKVVEVGEAVQGGSVDHVKCILEKMQVNYEIRSLPWRRARQEVHTSVIDGFFTAVAIDDANEFATFSAPLVLENWYWFWRTDMVAPASWKQHYPIGVILGSQQETILNNEGYSDFVAANNVPQLLKLLFTKRVDAVLLDKEIFEKAAAELNVSSRDYKSRFFRYMPLGVYFGAPFLAQNPEFLSAFNSRIDSCASVGFDLSSNEQSEIQKIVAPWFAQILRNKDLIAAVVQQNATNKNKSDTQLQKLDEQWQLAFKIHNLDFPKSLINQILSNFLGELKNNSNELLAEIIVMDGRGYNIAMSSMTSDYWQGDEEKFTKAFNGTSDFIFVDKIKYDASSKRFQVQLSAPLVDPKTQKSIGAVTLGIDVDKALSQSN